MGARQEYVPALGLRWLTRFYDPLVRLTLRERRFKEDLITEAAIRSGQRVLDLGCGTGTLTLMIKERHPGAEVSGVDGAPEILELARRKASRAGLGIGWVEGLASALPYPVGSFDRVLSSLLFHHLRREDKRKALAEARRVLRPGGELHLADWGKAQNPLMRAAFLLVQALDGFETTADNAEGALPGLIQEAGFAGVTESSRRMTLFGTLSFYKGRKP